MSLILTEFLPDVIPHLPKNRLDILGGCLQEVRLYLYTLLFAVLVNRLCQDWPERIKYVDDTSVFEIVPRCSPSYLPSLLMVSTNMQPNGI